MCLSDTNRSLFLVSSGESLPGLASLRRGKRTMHITGNDSWKIRGARSRVGAGHGGRVAGARRGADGPRDAAERTARGRARSGTAQVAGTSFREIELMQ